MEKRFGELFSDSWKEWKASKGAFFKLVLFLSAVPSILFFLFSLLTSSHPVIYYIIQVLINVTLSLLLSLSILYLAFFKKKETTAVEAFKKGSKFFWKYLGLSIVTGFFLVLLFLLLIVPGIIFSVFWIFAAFILIRENTGIMESLRRSKLIVKGRWWKTLGYSFLFGLIVLLISLPVYIISSIISLFIALGAVSSGVVLNMSSLSLSISIPLTLLTVALTLITNWIIIPLSILFYKNFYLSYRTNLKS